MGAASRPLRRLVVLVGVAVLAAATLSACRTNVGYAATIDGARYSESDIGDYLTPSAQPVRRQETNGAQSEYPVRAFVVETLIGDKLLTKAAAALPSGAPSASVLSQVRTQVLQGASVSKAVTAAGIRGFSRSFDELLVHRVTVAQYLQSAAQQGVPVQQVLGSVPFRVSVNPRYGTWNTKTRAFDGAAAAGAPGFLTLQSKIAPRTGATGSTATPSAAP